MADKGAWAWPGKQIGNLAKKLDAKGPTLLQMPSPFTKIGQAIPGFPSDAQPWHMWCSRGRVGWRSAKRPSDLEPILI